MNCETAKLTLRLVKLSIPRKRSLFACTIAGILVGLNGFALATEHVLDTGDGVVSFSYDAASSRQYIERWPGYEEDTIFAPNHENNPPRIDAPRPDIRFIGKGKKSAIDTDAISYGYSQDPRGILNLSVYFSVLPGSLGLANTGVWTEPPVEQGSDIYRSAIDGRNHQLYDGNGLGMQPGARKLGLMEMGSTHVDGLDMRASWDQNLGPQPMNDKKFYWSVVNANGWGGIISQLEYATLGYFGRDIFVGQPENNYSNNPAGILKYADGGDLGLTDGDDIDGLLVVELDANPDDFDPSQDLVLFSLTGSSNSLALPDFAGGVLNKSGADIFYVGNGVRSPKRLYTARNLGLDPRDDIVSFDFAQHAMVRSAMMVPEPGTLTLVLGASLLSLCSSRTQRRILRTGC